MVSVLQADNLILDSIFPSAEEWMPLQNLRDEWLTQDVEMNQHDPQFHRVAVDGIAIAWRIWQAGHRFFPITEVESELTAPLSLAKPFESFRVKAGDNLPAGTDCVVPLAQASIHDDMACISNSLSLRRWDHIQRIGSCFKEGDVILCEGSRLLSPEWAAAASAGLDGLKVAERPKISLFTAGWSSASERNPPGECPGYTGTSRYGILSSLRSHGFEKIEIYRLEDRLGSGNHLISQLLNDAKVLIFTDGSMQRMDREMPDALTKAGIEKVFRTVAQQPGSDFFFGLGPNQQFVFGLPSDANASLMIAHRFILPALTSMVSSQRPFACKGQPRGVLTQAIVRDLSDTSYLPVTIHFNQSGSIEARPLPIANGLGAGNLVGSDGFVEIASRKDAGHSLVREQEAVPLWLWRQSWL